MILAIAILFLILFVLCISNFNEVKCLFKLYQWFIWIYFYIKGEIINQKKEAELCKKLIDTEWRLPYIDCMPCIYMSEETKKLCDKKITICMNILLLEN